MVADVLPDVVPLEQRCPVAIPTAAKVAVAIRYGVPPDGEWHPVPCWWCGAVGKASWIKRPTQTVGYVGLWGMEWDHLIPRSRGGTHHPDNIVIACSPCNRSRGNRPLPSGGDR